MAPQPPHTCIATNPSDMNVALAALNATVEVQGPSGKRTIPIADFHRLPGDDPATRHHPQARRTHHRRRLSRPRSSQRTPGTSKPATARATPSPSSPSPPASRLDGNTIRSAGLALGGVAHKPWRSPKPKHALAGQPATPETFRKAADLALPGAKGYEHNTFKIELAKQSIVRALTLPPPERSPGMMP